MYFHGAFLATKQAGNVQILVPRTDALQHPDESEGHHHLLFLASFDKPGEGNPNLGSPEEVKDSQITLVPNTPKLPDVRLNSGLFYFKDFAPNVKIRRDPKYLYSEITLQGGVIEPWYAKKQTGIWLVDPILLQPCPSDPACPPPVKVPGPSIGLIWRSGGTEVKAMAGTRVLKTIKGNRDSVVVGHSRLEPGHWNDARHEIPSGTVDNDFKWLYQILIPDDRPDDDPDPWAPRLGYKRLPAPKYASTRTPGSPTCFGGCYGCE